MPELQPIPSGVLEGFDDLPEAAQTMIRRAQEQFGSLYDNVTAGQPHFQEDSPSFDDDRWAVLLWNAVGRVNMTGAPKTSYTVSGYPYSGATGGYAVYLALLIEAMRHFIVTYTEHPQDNLQNAPFLKHDHWQRWKDTLSIIERDFESAVAAFKYESMGFGQSALLIGGRQVPYGYTPKVRPSTRYFWGW